ncbi:MAG: prephenate dehydrogenase/arogenate dehydrogenase family protein [Clostridia bacterium]|nr:prephenate dehydrogenase/arogenate dehydrogenase family protein [Clostridia bacterium]
MEWINQNKILIVGLGLIGGGYAKALSRIGYDVYAIDANPDSIGYAIDNGIILDGSIEPTPELVGSADAVIFAIYPDRLVKWIKDYQQYFKPGIRITDVTGVKCSVVYDVQAILRDDVEFIAAHPMAGREVYGVRNSTERIFHDANYLVVPTEKNTPEAIEWCKRLGKLIGFRKVSVLSPEEHDKAIGYVSQLTHVIAVALMTCNDNRHLSDYTGDSFRDLTRIARINDEMWSTLFFMNKDALLQEMNMFINEMTKMRDLLQSDDVEGMRAKLRLSNYRRSWFDDNKKEGK